MSKITSVLSPTPLPGIVEPDGLKELAAGLGIVPGLTGIDVSLDEQLAALPPALIIPSEGIDVDILEELARRSETGACQALGALAEAIETIHGLIGTGAPVSWAGGNFSASYNGITRPIVRDRLDRCPASDFVFAGLAEGIEIVLPIVVVAGITLGAGTVAAGLGGVIGATLTEVTTGVLEGAQAAAADTPALAVETATATRTLTTAAIAAAGIVLVALFLR